MLLRGDPPTLLDVQLKVEDMGGPPPPSNRVTCVNIVSVGVGNLINVSIDNVERHLNLIINNYT